MRRFRHDFSIDLVASPVHDEALYKRRYDHGRQTHFATQQDRRAGHIAQPPQYVHQLQITHPIQPLHGQHPMKGGQIVADGDYECRPKPPNVVR